MLYLLLKCQHFLAENAEFFFILTIQYSVIVDGEHEEKLLLKQFSELFMPFSCLSVFCLSLFQLAVVLIPFLVHPTSFSVPQAFCMENRKRLRGLNWCHLERLQGERLR